MKDTARRAPERTEPAILQLSEVTDTSVGGKAYGLSRLTGMGLAVPPAFVIRHAQRGRYPDGLREAWEALGKHPVAVRSSAEGEDGADDSFAGQYDTVLDVQGYDALLSAIDQCVASLYSERAREYAGRQEGDAATMNIVVQRMVNARAAGVAFTADPVSARRDVLVIDAVAGLGEALVSGEATPDHFALDRQDKVIHQSLAGEAAVLSAEDLAGIARGARQAEVHEGHPLDLEWAIDADGELYWLQARPVTTLPADLNECDTTLPRPDDVLTISNIGEMMPGAVCPLTGSFTGWSIDYGLQHMQVAVGTRERIDKDWQVTAWAYGHLFLNLTGNIVMSAGVLGSTPEQTAQTLCGRPVPELKALPPLPTRRRVINTLRLLRYALGAPKVVQRFDAEVAGFHIAHLDDASSMMAQLSEKAWFYEHAMAVHIQSSSLSGFLSAIVENMVAKRSNHATLEEQAEAMRLLAGATEVESAEMVLQLDALVDHIASLPEARSSFCEAQTAAALHWLRHAPETGKQFEQFLAAHGHRGYRELCMRDPSWAEDQEQLVQSMQAGVRARLAGATTHSAHHASVDVVGLSRGLKWILPKAHNAVRRREHTKSHLVTVAHRFKRAFAHLGELLVSEGSLPDADLVYFFTFEELPGFVASQDPAMVRQAELRRAALPFQQRFDFPEISVGAPTPLQEQVTDAGEGKIAGRPASSGVVEGTARVAHTLAEAAELQPGEILVTPITDIGWTPYFSMIAGLVTDLGSAVSHGAVIAREYGLPCVVNSRVGTRVIKSGDRLRLDGDSGMVEILN
ncbi:pyruvate, water dikinase [Pseudohalioglobus sediminis]|uniref:Pyruvate, water dikinase n=1 Tax=Pseudohalioglobus sediminis TaxID=2606449 RepID=A0A5B0WZZ0_9GAMM|nr:PEP/pyruvate-binding domain-containing protein [Pseudohalioglobus sediminis]KAA1191908.1 pyruvate, water dikinase [Pseudohalioglobus sediminis]